MAWLLLMVYRARASLLVICKSTLALAPTSKLLKRTMALSVPWFRSSVVLSLAVPWPVTVTRPVVLPCSAMFSGLPSASNSADTGLGMAWSPGRVGAMKPARAAARALGQTDVTLTPAMAGLKAGRDKAASTAQATGLSTGQKTRLRWCAMVAPIRSRGP